MGRCDGLSGKGRQGVAKGLRISFRQCPGSSDRTSSYSWWSFDLIDAFAGAAAQSSLDHAFRQMYFPFKKLKRASGFCRCQM